MGGVILRSNRDQTYTVLVLCNHGNETTPISLIDFKSGHVTPHVIMESLFVPEKGVGHTLLTKVKGCNIVGVVKNVLTVDGSRLINDYDTRQLPRFK